LTTGTETLGVAAWFEHTECYAVQEDQRHADTLEPRAGKIVKVYSNGITNVQGNKQTYIMDHALNPTQADDQYFCIAI